MLESACVCWFFKFKNWAAHIKCSGTRLSAEGGRLTCRERISSSSMGGGDWEAYLSSLPLARFPSSPALPVPKRLTMSVQEASVFAGLHHKPGKGSETQSRRTALAGAYARRILSLVLPENRVSGQAQSAIELAGYYALMVGGTSLRLGR